MFHRALNAAALLVAMLVGISNTPVSADEGWVINTFDALVTVNNDSSITVREDISVDFRGLEKHGIFRDIPVVYRYDAEQNRVYDLSVRSVVAENGRRYRYETSREGSLLRIKIGDPDTTISGKQRYILTYDVRGALNGFPEHDELYWNVTGEWPVATESVKVAFALPADGIQRIACFQGPAGSQETCTGTYSPAGAEFAATRVLPEKQQMTIVVGFSKGIVPEPAFRLERREREFEEFFDVTPMTLGTSGLVFIGALAWVGRLWWRGGRDRRFVTMYYLTDDPRQETKPLFSRDPIVIEYTPPEKLRPAHMGLLLDERADTLDATATIVDLAVRGHLRIEEIDRKVLGIVDLGHNNWRLHELPNAEDDVEPYERKLLDGLFQDGSPVLLSDLKTKFHKYLNEAQDKLYEDAQQRKFFPERPDSVRRFWLVVAGIVAAVGVAIVFGLGMSFGAGLVGVPVLLVGGLLFALAGSMPRRTALGREMLRRTLGFRQYVATAEKERQRYNEQVNIFASYLPYAMVFGCVDKWAKALESLGATPEQFNTWYVGSNPLRATAFSHNMMGFSSDVSSIIVSTPGGSGNSGFSGGGSSGGGGGGGGGGSW